MDIHSVAPKKKDKKGKKGSKKAGSGKTQTVIDGVPVSSMSKEQLEGHFVRVRSELEREREERNFIQTELERVQRLWEVAAENLDNVRSQLRYKDAELAEAEEKHQQQMKFCEQKMKHLMESQESRISHLQVESETALLNIHEDALKEEDKTKLELEELRAQLKTAEAKYLSVIADLKLNHSEALQNMRQEFEAEAIEMEAKFVRKTKELESQLELKRKTELTAQEERKNNFLSALIGDHEKTFEEMKKYYTDITSTNLKLITELKSELENQKAQERQVAIKMANAQNDRKSLEETIEHLTKQLEEEQRALKRFHLLNHNLKTCRAQNKVIGSEKEALQQELEMVKQRAEKIEQERSDLYEQFVAVVSEVQQRSEMRNIVLEKRLKELSEQLEKREAVLSEVLTATNLDPTSFANVTKQLEVIVDEKNKLVTGLREEVATLRRMYANLLDEKNMPSPKFLGQVGAVH